MFKKIVLVLLVFTSTANLICMDGNIITTKAQNNIIEPGIFGILLAVNAPFDQANTLLETTTPISESYSHSTHNTDTSSSPNDIIFVSNSNLDITRKFADYSVFSHFKLQNSIGGQHTNGAPPLRAGPYVPLIFLSSLFILAYLVALSKSNLPWEMVAYQSIL